MRMILLLLLLPARVQAHEAWLERVDGGVALRIGERFVGEPRTFRAARTASLRLVVDGGVRDVSLPDAGELAVLPPGAAELVAYDSLPSTITLAPDAFTAYLREEGLHHVIAERADAGQSSVPGRERYRRCLKALLRPGAHAFRTGQVLELVPLSDPLSAGPGREVPVRLLLRGQPLSGAQVRAWSHRKSNLVVIDGLTAADGTITFELPHAGRWMISTVHMARTRTPDDVDWESHWASLTFEASLNTR